MNDQATLVVVPALNEAATVGTVVAAVTALGLPCLVIDDTSDDDTGSIARAAGARVLRMPVNLGVGAALRTGFRYAVAHGYKRVVQCDGDGQHPPEQIPKLLEAQARTGAQLLIGSRFLDMGESFPIGRARRITMRLLSRLVRLRSGVAVSDTTSGFRCVSEPLLSAFSRSFPTHYLGDTFEAVLVAARSGYGVAEEPVRMTAREAGSSSEGVAGSIRFVLRAVVVAVSGLTFQIRRVDDLQRPKAIPEHGPGSP